MKFRLDKTTPLGLAMATAVACGLMACGSGGAAAETSPAAPATAESAQAGSGRIVYSLGEEGVGGFFRIAAERGAKPENISAKLDRIAPGGGDEQITASPDGKTLLIDTHRLGCEDTGCLALVDEKVTKARVVRVGGQPVAPEFMFTVTNGGRTIVYPSQDGPNEIDLWVATGGPTRFGKPRLLTGRSPGSVNLWPSISPDGRQVAFSCGDVRDSYSGNVSICRVGVRGQGLRTLIDPRKDGRPTGTSTPVTTWQPHYAPDASIVFESNWGGRDWIWRLPRGGGKPRVQAKLNNNVGPCVLPDGRVASLWLGRPGNENGVHELTVTTATGKRPLTLLPQVDVSDGGLGCSA